VTRQGYFPILDPLRFLASLCVFLAHSVVFFKVPVASLSFNDLIKDAGYYGVIFFFVLSGFLITWLLLREKKATGTIALRRFYIRRVLRIWPLYYLIVGLSFFVFPHLIHGHPAAGIGNWGWPFLLYALFLPNIVPFTGFYLATCFHTYTIGYEEQFYLFWPLILRRAGRYLRYALAGLFLLPVLLEIVHGWLMTHGYALPGRWDGLVRETLDFIPAFIAGAIAAFLYLEGSDRLRVFIGKKIWRYGLIALIGSLMWFIIPGRTGYSGMVSLLFAFLILHLVQSDAGVGRIGMLLARGGKISYGIYIYHAAVLIGVSLFMTRMHIAIAGWPLLTYLIYLLLSFVLLLLTAAASYRYFEKFFLRKKERWRTGGV
jgi:peptidoglycan/LPS O-acetylase OafA/YrhL